MIGRIAAARLENHGIDRPRAATPEAVVAWLGAVQAQDYRAALWAVGLRLPNGDSVTTVERSLNEGRILRTHVLRPTWHFVAATDIHWLLELTAPHVQRRLETYCRHLGLDRDTRRRGTKVIERALANGQHRTRPELATELARAGLPLKGVRLALLTLHAELERVVCSGARRGNQSTYTLLPDRAPRTRFSHDEAVAELARRYLRSHAPATIRDFVWWSGLPTRDARHGIEAIGGVHKRIGDHTYWRLDEPSRATPLPVVHLLPVYDEYLVAYRDLHAVPRGPSVWGVLPQAVVSKGQIAGTWKAIRQRDGVTVQITHATRFTRVEQRALAQAIARYLRFHQVRK